MASIETIRYYRNDYLRSAHWSNLRLQKLAETDARCEICLDRDFQSDVHHKQYRNLFDVTTHDLVTLCRRCHSYAHEEMKECATLVSTKDANKRWSRVRKMVQARIKADLFPDWKNARTDFVNFLTKRGFVQANEFAPPISCNKAIDWFYNSVNKNPDEDQWMEACKKWGTWIEKLNSLAIETDYQI